MKKLVIAISSLIMLATSAFSATLTPSVGISGSFAAYSAKGTEQEYDNGDKVGDTQIVRGAFATEYASVFVELGLNDVISLGVDYVPGSFETPQNISNEDQTNENRVSAKFEDLTTIYAKVNVPLGGLYLKAGVSQADVLSQESMASGSTYGNDSTSGITYGLGYDHEVAGGMSIRAEVTYAEFDDVETSSNAATANRTQIDVSEMIGGRATISVVKSF